MEYKVRILPKHNLVIEEVSGQITLEALIEKMKFLFSAPHYQPSYCGVVDLRKGNSRMSKIELLGFANLINESDQFGQAPWAILCTDPMVVALSRVFKLRVRNPETIGVFETVAEAAQFVGKPVLNDLLLS